MINVTHINNNTYFLKFSNDLEVDKYIYINGVLNGVTNKSEYTLTLNASSSIEILEENEIPTGFYNGNVLINVTNNNHNNLRLFIDDTFNTTLYSSMGIFEYNLDSLDPGVYNIKIKDNDDVILSESVVTLIKSPIIPDFEYNIEVDSNGGTLTLDTL